MSRQGHGPGEPTIALVGIVHTLEGGDCHYSLRFSVQDVQRGRLSAVADSSHIGVEAAPGPTITSDDNWPIPGDVIESDFGGLLVHPDDGHDRDFTVRLVKGKGGATVATSNTLTHTTSC